MRNVATAEDGRKLKDTAGFMHAFSYWPEYQVYLLQL